MDSLKSTVLIRALPVSFHSPDSPGIDNEVWFWQVYHCSSQVSFFIF